MEEWRSGGYGMVKEPGRDPCVEAGSRVFVVEIVVADTLLGEAPTHPS